MGEKNKLKKKKKKKGIGIVRNVVTNIFKDLPRAVVKSPSLEAFKSQVAVVLRDRI